MTNLIIFKCDWPVLFIWPQVKPLQLIFFEWTANVEEVN